MDDFQHWQGRNRHTDENTRAVNCECNHPKNEQNPPYLNRKNLTNTLDSSPEFPGTCCVQGKKRSNS